MTDEQTIPPELGRAREQFLALVNDVRPELHRYCARIAGSTVDGEDIVQGALGKAFYALGMATELPPLRPWLFRIAHNTAIDFVRGYEKKNVEPRADFDEIAGADDESADQDAVHAALVTFLDLPVLQRSAVILKDVLGHSLEEAALTIGTTVPAVKAALVRGRTTLRASQVRASGADKAADIEPAQLARLEQYAALFNARNWDGLRALLSEECRLDLVAKATRRGKEVHGYFARYAGEPGVRLEVGSVDGRPALHVVERGAPPYFILLEWKDDRIALIRDYRYVSYIAREISL